MREYSAQISSPIGVLTLTATDAGVTAVSMEREGSNDAGGDLALPDHPVLRRAAEQLAEYFAGTRTRFDLPLAPSGTSFQQQVWSALRAIPYGETRSYADIARQLGRPTATRAVGAANGRNPIAIVTPCHRVIGSNGALTGFAGGLENKRRLLDLERRATQPTLL